MATKPVKKPGSRKPSQPHQASEEAVLSRARRLAAEQMKPLMEALGAATTEELTAKISELNAAKADQLGAAEKLAAKVEQLEARLAETEQREAEYRAEKEKAAAQVEELKSEIEWSGMVATFREGALASGIKDPEYGVTLWQRYLDSLSEDSDEYRAIEADLSGSVQSFFTRMRQDPAKKYLFEPEEVPAGPPSEHDKSPSGEPAEPTNLPPSDPKAPQPGPASPPGEVDATKMSREDFRTYSQQKYDYRPTVPAGMAHNLPPAGS